MTDVTQVTSHTVAALLHVGSQFLGKENFEKLLTIIGEEIDEVEQAFFDLLNLRSLETAEGEQLDVIGVRLDLSRSGRTDTEYRSALYAKVGYNIASGTPDQVISLTKLITGITDLKYQEFYPAHVRIELYADFPSILAVTQLKQLLPVGVGPLELLSWGLETNVFSFSTTDGPQDDTRSFADGFGTTDDPLLGGVMSSIYEVAV
jgi:hypothetical protein